MARNQRSKSKGICTVCKKEIKLVLVGSGFGAELKEKCGCNFFKPITGKIGFGNF